MAGKHSFWRHIFQRKIDLCKRHSSNHHIKPNDSICGTMSPNTKRRKSIPYMGVGESYVETGESNEESSLPDMGSTMPNIDLLIFLHYQKENRFYRRRGALKSGKQYMCD